MIKDSPATTGTRPRRGRPPATTPHEIQLAALDLFQRNGYDETSVEDIAAAVGIGRSTFFSYFRSKSSVIWYDLDENHRRLVDALAAVDRSLPVMDAILEAVLRTIIYDEDDRVFYRDRNRLVFSHPVLSVEINGVTGRWAPSIADAVRERAGAKVHPALPLAIGYAAVGAIAAALTLWSDASTGTTGPRGLVRWALEPVVGSFQTTLDRGADGFPQPPAPGVVVA